MKIAITGTRGIPNNYGGFERFAERFSLQLADRGHEVTVYNPHTHPYKKNEWNHVRIIHSYDPEGMVGTAGQFIYDLNCILDCRRRNYDIILQLGYTSSTVWGSLLPRKKSVVVTNMDGLEWKRSKYAAPIKRFLLYAEKLAIKYSDYLVADSIGIQDYLQKKYRMPSRFIAYGSDIFISPEEVVLKKYNLEKYNYNLLIARMEPENNIETILDAACLSINKKCFFVVGNTDSRYGKYLRNKYIAVSHIRFADGIYNMADLNNLRYFSNIYFHGHSVGGTNPSLLEAMAAGALICAHDNIFNRSILGDDGYYFTNEKDIVQLLASIHKDDESRKLKNNVEKIREHYSWETITEQYLQYFRQILDERRIIIS